MNIQNLSTDAKASIFKNLTGKELVGLCNSSKSMKAACQNPRINGIWQEKIEEDFAVNYNGADAYQEYLRLAYTFSQSYYTIVFEEEEEDEPLLFYTLEAAKSYLIVYKLVKAYTQERKRWSYF